MLSVGKNVINVQMIDELKNKVGIVNMVIALHS